MYYKITNKESKVYQDLHAQRTKEIEIESENERLVQEKIVHEYKGFLGRHGQQTFSRTSEYHGFSFKNPAELDPKIWVKDKKHSNVYVPNTRTKKGREMKEFLLNGLKGSRFDIVFQLVGIKKHNSRFTFPFMEIVGDVILLYMDDNHEPLVDDVIEITSKEFDQILNKG
jgi:hypothetical protein